MPTTTGLGSPRVSWTVAVGSSYHRDSATTTWRPSQPLIRVWGRVVIGKVTRPVLSLIWDLRGTVSPYDAACVALATALRAPLVATGRRLAAAPRVPCTVELI